MRPVKLGLQTGLMNSYILMFTRLQTYAITCATEECMDNDKYIQI